MCVYKNWAFKVKCYEYDIYGQTAFKNAHAIFL